MCWQDMPLLLLLLLLESVRMCVFPIYTLLKCLIVMEVHWNEKVGR